MRPQDQFLFRPNTDPDITRNVKATDAVFNENLKIIGRPRRKFFSTNADSYSIWAVFHPQIDQAMNRSLLLRIQFAFASFSGPKQGKYPLCRTVDEVRQWTKNYDLKLIVDGSDLVNLANFVELFKLQKVILVYVVSDNYEVIEKVSSNQFFDKKLKDMHLSYDSLLLQIKVEMERLIFQSEEQPILQRVILPNFMELSLKGKQNVIKYRNNIYCLVNLHSKENDLKQSKKLFIEECEKNFPNDKTLTEVNYSKLDQSDEEILQLYTAESIFYKCLNNILRKAVQTNEFFLIGQPFNRMFSAIRDQYKLQQMEPACRKSFKVYRGPSLTESECQSLEKSIGGFIEFYGFLSTSTSLQVAKKFANEKKQIIEIHVKMEGPFKEEVLDYDNGFIDLNSFSKFKDQNETLFNALSIFKVVEKRLEDGYEFFVLEYGDIFRILSSENPASMSSADAYAYSSYREILSQRESLKDLGQVFLKNNEPEKALKYYQNSKEPTGDNIQESVTHNINLSKALSNSGQPEEALLYLSKLQAELLKNLQGNQNILRESEQSIRESNQLLRITQGSKNSMAYIEAMINEDKAGANTSLDQYEKAEADLISAENNLAKLQTQKWSFELAMRQLEIMRKQLAVEAAQQFYQNMLHILQRMDKMLVEVQAKNSEAKQEFNNRVVWFEQTGVYYEIARIYPNLQGMPNLQSLLSYIEKQFEVVEQKLVSALVNDQNKRQVIEIRKVELKKLRPNNQQAKQNLIEQLSSSISIIRENSHNDVEIPRIYHSLAELQGSKETLASSYVAMNYFKQEKSSTELIYGVSHPKTFVTTINISRVHRKTKDYKSSLSILKKQSSMAVFKDVPNHSTLSTTKYQMGIIYLDLKEYTFALTAFTNATEILKEILSDRDFNRSLLKNKISLEIGRTYIYIDTQISLVLAEENLRQSTTNIKAIHLEVPHSDVAQCENYYGKYYTNIKDNQKALKSFNNALMIYQMIQGNKSINCAKIRCNLALIYASEKRYTEAKNQLGQAKLIFNQSWLKPEQQNNLTVGKDEAKVHKQTFMINFYYAEISFLEKKYEQAIAKYNQSIAAESKYIEMQASAKADPVNIRTTYMSSSNAIVEKSEAKSIHTYNCRLKIIMCLMKCQGAKRNELLKQLYSLVEELSCQIQKEGFEQLHHTTINRPAKTDKKSKLKKTCESLIQSLKKNKEA